ncbi:type I restriction-modification system HsdS subunit protein [Rhizobium sp. TAL182]|uniref:restriction endonuclease subunit S n=1 Tax=Rhizobium sp. TAL182 TaxID=2020313 RepID=UPI000A210EBF|nr:restriction endonuclease subunit S [Rhizobium sp. TAL182]ARO23976.1 type I restriction-modification system HsdS subunit protein [Rhizobium sp. TAL182]
MSEWRTYRIADLGRIVTGKTPPSSQPELFDGNIPFITPSDMGYDDRTISTERFVSTDWDSKKRTLLPASAVCVVCIGATIGKICMTSKPSQTNQQVNSVIVDPDLFDPGFVYYGLQTKAGELMARAAGAATPIINKTAFSEVEIDAPPLETQRRIASILGAYDDLIEVNRRQIAVLEEMARGLFAEWFVRFRFPGYEEVPIFDTPDGPLPEGWTWGTIGEVSRIIKSGSTPSRKEPAYWEDGVLEWFTTGELNNGFLFSANERVSKIAVDANKVRVFPVGTVFIALYGATIGALAIAAVECSSNQAALGIVPDGVRMRRWQLFHTLSHLKDWFISVGQGAAQQNISKEKVSAARVALPPARVSELFDRIVAPLWELRSVVERQNSHLSASRDLLLPRLISGQLSVEQAERELEEAA